MIIRRMPSSHQLMTQPAHAALAERIMQSWQADGFPESPRRVSILKAIAQHDDGWAAADDALVLDETTGRLLDFIEVPDAVKQDTSIRGIERVADPYTGALMAQHRLHVYRRYAEAPDWRGFFAEVTAWRDSYLKATGDSPLELLRRDYRLVRAGDLVSLAFCNNWPEVAAGECGYGMRLEGTTVVVTPDPFGGQSLEIDIEAREIPVQRFASAAAAREVLQSAPIITVQGLVRGAAPIQTC
jgi:hypothetical protein